MRRQHCYFCTNHLEEINCQDVERLKKFISPYGKIYGCRKTNLCAKHQRKISLTIKRARNLGLLSAIKR